MPLMVSTAVHKLCSNARRTLVHPRARTRPKELLSAGSWGVVASNSRPICKLLPLAQEKSDEWICLAKTKTKAAQRFRQSERNPGPFIGQGNRSKDFGFQFAPFPCN